jgi:uncharacterized protein (TIGR02646 family)
MKAIAKGAEPASLTAHRLTPHCDYGNYAAKDDLRAYLLREQGALCCYCMSRIHAAGRGMKIEHWHSQENHPREQLTYQNLLGGCMGGEGKPIALQHCDTRKGDTDIRFNPANPAHRIETRISYGSDGSIHSSDTIFDTQLNAVLNLNLAVIKNNRKGVLDALLIWWKGEKQRVKGQVPKALFERKLTHWSSETPDLTPYCQVAVWWLRVKLAGMA